MEYSQQEKNDLAAGLESMRASVGLFISPYSDNAQQQFINAQRRSWFSPMDMKVLRQAAEALRGESNAQLEGGNW